MDELPIVPLVGAAVVLLVGPVRRRVVSVATATGVTGLSIVAVTARGAADIVRSAVRGERPSEPAATS